MKWMSEPTMVLDKPGTLALLQSGWPSGTDNHTDKWRIKSQWLCDELNRFEADGYVYNAQALRRIEKENQVGPFDENGSVLSILIYNAQGYRRQDKVLADGFKRLDAALVAEAIAKDCKIEILGENFIGAPVRVEGYRPVINPDGTAFVLAPRKRNKGFRADGQQAARLIP